MNWLNRIEVRLIGLIVLVVVATNFITFGISAYYTQRNIRELPRDVRDVLQDPERGQYALLPRQVSREIVGMLAVGEVGVRMEATAGRQVFLLRDPTGEVQAIPVPTAPPAPRPDFRTRLQQSLLIASLASVALGVLLALVFSRRLARPIQAVSSAANRLALGDLAVRIPDPRGGDETAQLARSFNHMAESLERLEVERRAMIADIAHELRTPLTVMQGRLEAIQDGVVPLEAGEVDRLHRQTGLLSRLVEDLRTLSLADAGRLTLERRAVDLGDLVEGVAAGYLPQATARGVRLQTRVPSAPVIAQADPDRLAQVFGNLISNALTHTPDGGAVQLEVLREGQTACLAVRDTGPGIPQAALPEVFDRFFRADDSRSRATGGSGLGLSIVKALVELHGGTVSARNRLEGGAEFRVCLPL